jgi:hypothetical protein
MTRDEILNSNEVPTDTFLVPRWGSVTIRELSGEEREEIESMIQSFAKHGGKKSVRATAAVISLINTDNTQMFKREDIPALAKKSGVALDAVWERVLTFNAMSKAEAVAIAGN